MLEQQYAQVRSALKESWDGMWPTAARSERMRLLKSACLSAADESIRSEVDQIDDEIWDSVLAALEAEIAIIVQSVANTRGTWEDAAILRGPRAFGKAMLRRARRVPQTRRDQ